MKTIEQLVTFARAQRPNGDESALVMNTKTARQLEQTLTGGLVVGLVSYIGHTIRYDESLPDGVVGYGSEVKINKRVDRFTQMLMDHSDHFIASALAMLQRTFWNDCTVEGDFLINGNLCFIEYAPFGEGAHFKRPADATYNEDGTLKTLLGLPVVYVDSKIKYSDDAPPPGTLPELN